MTPVDLDHVTAIVADADAAASALEIVLGAPPVGAIALPGMSIRTFRAGATEIHVNAPTGPGPVLDHHRAKGPGLHHLALRVDATSTGASSSSRPAASARPACPSRPRPACAKCSSIPGSPAAS